MKARCCEVEEVLKLFKILVIFFLCHVFVYLLLLFWKSSGKDGKDGKRCVDPKSVNTLDTSYVAQIHAPKNKTMNIP